jgi:hypothetical protein
VATEPGEAEHNDALRVTSGACVAHTHLCEICVFLVQARCDRPQIVESETQHRIVGSAAPSDPLSYVPTTLCWHSPRGPPQLG